MFCQECGTRKAEGALYCTSCGTPLAAQPEQPQTRLFHSEPMQPARRGLLRRGVAWLGLMKRRLLPHGLMKSCLMVSGALFALVIGCAGLNAILEDGGEQAAAIEHAAPQSVLEDERVDEVDLTLSEQQTAFIRMVDSFSERYEEAENELQSSAQRAKRRTALAKLLPDRTVQGWTGTLESLDTDARGNAYITIEPEGAESITIATWNNALADSGTHSMISSGSELYDKLAEMREGDPVIFSGTFAADEQDHIAEGSLAEDKAMTTPDFVMVFSDVTKQE